MEESPKSSHVKRGLTEINQRIVSSPEVTKSDYSVGFCGVDWVENEVSFYTIFLSLKFENKGV